MTSKGQNLYWTMRWQAGKGNKLLSRLTGHRGDDVGRNYGQDQRFLDSPAGRRRLHHLIDILLQQGILRPDLDSAFELARRNIQVARILITLGYAFGR